MSTFTAKDIERATEHVRAHLPQISETLRQTLTCDIRLADCLRRAYDAQTLAGQFEGAGLIVSLAVGEQGLLCLIPETIALPDWCREPGPDPKRLKAFADQLVRNLLPGDFMPGSRTAVPASNLRHMAEQAQVNPAAAVLDLPVLKADDPDGEPAIANLLLLFPVDAPLASPADAAEGADESIADVDDAPTAQEVADDALAAVEMAADALAAVSAADAGEPSDAPSDEGGETRPEPRPGYSISDEMALRALRILRVPVTVSVRLADRKMPLGQIVALVPGALIQFNKSCEELLDLFVNNRQFCHGEAVKIGENFGLKIAKIEPSGRR